MAGVVAHPAAVLVRQAAVHPVAAVAPVSDPRQAVQAIAVFTRHQITADLRNAHLTIAVLDHL